MTRQITGTCFFVCTLEFVSGKFFVARGAGNYRIILYQSEWHGAVLGFAFGLLELNYGTIGTRHLLELKKRAYEFTENWLGKYFSFYRFWNYDFLLKDQSCASVGILTANKLLTVS